MPRLKVSGKDMKQLPCIADAWLALEDDKIVGFGRMEDWEGIADWTNLTVIDATDKLVLPCYCDSHTHIVYAGSREGEFVDRINGLTYEEIFARGGGIINSSNKLRAATEDELVEILKVWRNRNVDAGYEYVVNNHHIRTTVDDIENVLKPK